MRVGVWKTVSKSPDQPSRRKAAEVSGHNTPGMARSQMTKLQNATDKRMPVKPLTVPARRATALEKEVLIPHTNPTETLVSVDFIAGIFITPSGTGGVGAGS